MSYVEYKEVKVPDEYLGKDAATMTDAGIIEWLNKLAREEGWRVIWTTFHNFPFLMLEREVNPNE